jgi:ABC-2 type transport system permease protein
VIANVGAELLLLRKRTGTWVLLAVWAALGTLFGYLFPYLSYRSGGFGPVRQPLNQLLPQNLVPNLVGSFPFYGGALVLVLGAMAIGSEFGWGTLKTLFTQRAGRLEVFASKMLALGIMLVPFVLTAFILGTVWGLLIAARENVAVEWPQLWPLLQGLAAAWFILAVWAALGVMLAVVTRGTALAIGIGVLYGLVIEGLLGGFANVLSWLKPVVEGLLRANAYSLVRPLSGASLSASAGAGPGFFPGPFVTSGQALLVLALYLAAFLLISAVVLARRDVV